MISAPRRRRPGLSLALALVGVVISFSIVTAYTQYSSNRIDSAADAIAYNSAPSIERLTAIRGEVRELQYLLARYVDRDVDDDRPPRAEVERSLTTLDLSMREYLAFPPFTGERELWHELQAGINDVNLVANRALAQVDIGSPHSAEVTVAQQLPLAATRASVAIGRLIELNAEVGRQMALTIKNVRLRSQYLAVGLDALCAALALVAGWLALRQVRRHAELMEQHQRFLEERGHELEMFAGRVAHDIMNPVSAANLAVQLAMQRASQAGDLTQVDLTERALRSLRRAQEISHALLEFARAGARPELGARSNVETVVREVIADLQDAADKEAIEISVAPLPREGLQAACSPGVLSSLLSNLVKNAIKYMGSSPVRRIEIRASERGARVRVEVEDSGPGVPASAGQTVFEPYVRAPNTQYQSGIGLGLATVKRLAEGHGGAAGLTPNGGEGSTFWFELPLAGGELVSISARSARSG